MLLYQDDADILFPERVIPALRDARSDDFRALVDEILACQSPTELRALGFSFMMMRMNSCMTCTSDSYRAINGCTQCALRTIQAYRGSDEEIRQKWQEACDDVRSWQEDGIVPSDI